MLRWLGLTAIIVLLDQLTKHWVVAIFELRERVNVLPFFDLTLAYNPGAAFSFLADAGGWQRWFFTIVAIVVSAGLVLWIKRLQPNEKWLAIALTLILGGALGNLYDRLLLGHVVDFLLFYWHPYYFPAFNIADSAISIGAAMIFLDVFFDFKKMNESKGEENVAKEEVIKEKAANDS